MNERTKSVVSGRKGDWRRTLLIFTLAALGTLTLMASSASAERYSAGANGSLSIVSKPLAQVPPPVPTGYPTVAPCYNFTDVRPSDWYYQYVHWLACNGAISGYGDGSFRPGNPSTRAQLTKVMVAAFRLPINTAGGPTFADVPASDPFYAYVETAARLDIIAGYPCGTTQSEPCDASRHPYFRPSVIVTRAQIAKIAVLSGQQVRPTRWVLRYPRTATFVDVPVGDAFFPYVETAINTGILQGYDCGGGGEPCPGRYFRPTITATRAQISKIAYLAALLP